MKLALGPTLVLVALARAAAGEDALGVEDAVAATLAAQPRLRAAQSEVRAAQARAEEAAWNRLGTVETTGLYTPTQRPLQIEYPGIPGLIPPTSFEVKQLDRYALNVSLTQPLFTWGALSGERSAARTDLLASRGSCERTRQQLVLQAEEAFLLAATASAAVGVAEQALEQQRAFLRATRSRMEAGSAARLDVLKAELSLAEAESDLLTTRNRATLARESLVTVTADARFRAAPLREVGEGALEAASEEEVIARALRQRPDLEALRRRGEALDLRAGAVQASSLPALGLRGTFIQQNDEAGRLFARQGQIYLLGLALSWDPAQALRTRPKVAELRALRDSLSESLRAAQDGVALEVRTALATAGEARQRLVVARGALATAEEQARVARLAYAEGTASALEARDAELGLTGARVALLRARLDLAVAQSRLRYAAGE